LPVFAMECGGLQIILYWFYDRLCSLLLWPVTFFKWGRKKKKTLLAGK
jgi:hypothetical protein